MSKEDTCALHWEILIIMKFALGLELEKEGRGGHREHRENKSTMFQVHV